MGLIERIKRIYDAIGVGFNEAKCELFEQVVKKSNPTLTNGGEAKSSWTKRHWTEDGSTTLPDGRTMVTRVVARPVNPNPSLPVRGSLRAEIARKVKESEGYIGDD
jgi:hypothetical protein